MLPAESTAIANGMLPVVPKIADAACAEPTNVAAQSSDAQTPASTVAQRREEEPTAKFIITDPQFPNSVGVSRAGGATVVARQQMTWKYLWRENYRMSPQNAAVALPRCSWARFPGSALGLSLVESSLLFQFSESDALFLAAAVSDLPTWNAGVLQPARPAKTAALTGGGLSV